MSNPNGVVNVAVVGCLHGELDRVYADIQRQAEAQRVTVDLVVVCGDFQAVRNHNDLTCMAVPPRYRKLGFFHDYYFGRKQVPILTVIVGGNHEASNYMSTLAFGGWVCPNIYYLGYSGVVRFGGLRIGGISGIFHKQDIDFGHFEALPYDQSSLRSVYHVRQLEAFKMRMIRSNEVDQQPLDIMMSHDWPLNIHTCGDATELIQKKPFFREEIQQNRLGNPLYQPLVSHLKPRYWFSAHLHIRFEAFVDHADNVGTNFLALDKSLPWRPYIEIVQIKPKVPGKKVLCYDPEWLAILKATNKYTSANKIPETKLPPPWINPEPVSSELISEVVDLFKGNLEVPQNFVRSSPVLAPDIDEDPQRTINYVNSQTTSFCETLGITDPMALIVSASKSLSKTSQQLANRSKDRSRVR